MQRWNRSQPETTKARHTCLRLLATLCLSMMLSATTPAIAQDDVPVDPPVEVVSEAPVPTEAPPAPPTFEPSPEPTLAPSPTEASLPTEAPVPTELPVEPTEVATEEPTATPTETPTPTPTPVPAIPFEPVVACQLLDGSALPIAGDSSWSFQDCTVTWQTENVSAVEASVWSDSAGWQVFAVNAESLGNQGILNISDGDLSLADSNSSDDGFFSSRFFIGTHLGCTATTRSLVMLDLAATSTAPVAENVTGLLLTDELGPTVVEHAHREIHLEATSLPQLLVAVDSVSFESIDVSEVTPSASASIVLNYQDAPAGCPWQIQIRLSDDSNAFHLSDLTVMEGYGLWITAETDENFTIHVPTNATLDRDGSIHIFGVLGVSLPTTLGAYPITVEVTGDAS